MTNITLYIHLDTLYTNKEENENLDQKSTK